MRSAMAPMWSSRASCSILRKPACTPATPSCVLPAGDLSAAVLATIRTYTRKLALALHVVGLVNLQFAIQRDKVFVIEVNPRASRTVPYVSKATGVPLAKIASRLMTGRTLRGLLPAAVASGEDLSTGRYFFVKSPVFPWSKFPGVDAVLGPEMRSTGEGDGGRRQLWRGIRQGAAGGRASPAYAWHGVL